MPRLLFAISAHGLGHLGQAAPICNAIGQLRPDITLSIWSALPIETLRQRIQVPFEHIVQECDIGFVMHDALQVDIPASWQRYQDRERDWDRHLDAACAIVRAAQPELIVSDIGDMPLAAGQVLDIPTIAISSLNWADMARAYFAELPDSAETLDRLTRLYDNATLALRLSPGMPMRGQREMALPPVGGVSAHARHAIDAALVDKLPCPDQPRVLIGMGGIETRLPLDDWPAQNRFNLLLANQPHLAHHGDAARGIVNADTLRAQQGWSFCDLLAGSDIVICKPGYGTFVEAALANVPILYVKRDDWPEQPVLIQWLTQRARCAELSVADFSSGNFSPAISGLLSQPVPPPLPRDGAMVAARTIMSVLEAG